MPFVFTRDYSSHSIFHLHEHLKQSGFKRCMQLSQQSETLFLFCHQPEILFCFLSFPQSAFFTIFFFLPHTYHTKTFHNNNNNRNSDTMSGPTQAQACETTTPMEQTVIGYDDLVKLISFFQAIAATAFALRWT